MAVDVVTEFGANTKKFDAAVEKSSKKAKANLENIGKGARVAGGAMGELVEKFNNLASGGKLGLIAAGLGVIFLIAEKIADMADKMFEKAVQDVENIKNDFAAMKNVRAGKHNDRDAALELLRAAVGKDSLTNKEQVELNRAIALLKTNGALGSGVSIRDGRLHGFNDQTDADTERSLIANRRGEIDAEMKILQKEIAKYDEEYERLMEWSWMRILKRPISWSYKYFRADAEKAEEYMKKKVNTQNRLAALIAERNRLGDRDELADVRAQARFDDIAAEEKKKRDAEARKKLLKELTEKRAGISFLGGASQMFTNSLTSRGGWAGGGKIWDTNRFQQQILQYNAQQQKSLQEIEKKIEELQRI